jgi:hypothetical protein
MSGARVRIPYALVATTGVLMALAAAAGIALPSAYRDPAWIEAAWLGSDIVTLFVAVPLLALGLVLARRGSRAGELLVCAMLGYAVYGYAYYLFGASLNVWFPLHVAIVVTAIVGLAVTLARADAAAVASGFAAGTPARVVAGYLALTGVGLGSAWLAQWAAYVFGGVRPSVGVDAFALVAALDMTLIVPFMVFAGVLLWRRRPWGFVLGAMMAVKGATYTLGLTASSAVGATRGIAGSAEQIPVWGAWTAIGLAACVLLFRGLAPRKA